MRLVWRNRQLRSLFLLSITALVVVIYINHLRSKSGAFVKRIVLRKKFLDLPETTNSHYKIWKNLYLSPYRDDLSVEDTTNVGIATQSSVYHLHNLIYLSRIWQGPISVGVFVLGSQWEVATKTIKNLVLCNRDVARYVTFHTLLPLSHPPDDEILEFIIRGDEQCDSTYKLKSKDKVQNYDNVFVSYPVNALRNIAVDNLGTSHVFMIDIDMVPSMDLRRFLIEKLKIDRHKESNAYVVPAFEIFSNTALPKSKSKLLEEWKVGRVRPFYSTVCWKCQKYTDYGKWQRGANEQGPMFYRVQWIDPWEPFYVINRKFVHYDERFEQYGFNRISQLCDVHLQGVDFVVLYGAFLVHVGFKDPNTFHKRKDEENNRNLILYRRYKKEKHGTSSNGRRC